MSAPSWRAGVVLVTGANGFVGQALCRALAKQNQRVRAAVRVPGTSWPLQEMHAGLEEVLIQDLQADIDWSPVLRDVSSIVHLAARVHITGREARADESFHATNVVATERLACAAAGAGVRSMVFLSSVKVNGGDTGAMPFRESDTPAPESAYGRSKWEAEKALARIARETNLSVTVLRPPLVYGPGVKANFFALMRLVAAGLPLPLASISNRRSLIYVRNLVDAILRSIESQNSGMRTYLVSDGVPVSTPELCRELATALDRVARLFPIPPALLELAPPLRKLTRSLEIDDSMIRRELAWDPPFTLHEGLRATAKHYLAEVRAAPG